MTELSKTIESLSPAKRALLELKLKKQGSEYNSFPLSFNQKRLWFIDQFEPGNPAYNIPSAFRINGPLKMSVLHKAINEIVSRHEILRTTFSATSGEPFQLVSSKLAVKIPIIDLQNLPKGIQKETSESIALTEAKQSFNLSKGPLLRITLLKLDQEEYIVFLTMHHIVSDGWSMGVFVREIAILYQSFLDGKPSPLPALTLQYADYAKWQIKKFDQSFIKDELQYWRKKLGENPPALNLPTDFPRPAVMSIDGASLTFELSKKLSDQLKEFSRKEGVTLFMTLLAVFQTLLYRYSGQEQISVGSPIANRTRAETEDLIGFFINTLVFNTDLSGDPTFRELLARVKVTTLDAYEHQDMPFEKLVEALEPERDTSQTPLFQVMFVLQNIPNRPAKTADLTLTPLSYDRGVAQFDLTFNVTDNQDGIFGLVEYRTSLFKKETIKRLVNHFNILLENIVASPDLTISSFPILSEPEKKWLISDLNETKTDFHSNICIHQLFEEQVEKNPEAIAVVYEDQTLTYRELNQQANPLARYLKQIGLQPGEIVGVSLNRSIELIVALLSILKAGGAYVPLDPTYPEQRLSWIIEDSGLTILLTQSEYISRFDQNEQIKQVFCIDKNWNDVNNNSVENLLNLNISDNLAYVIFTSGSTGRPKGVSCIHKSVINFLDDFQNRKPISPGDRCSWWTSLNFDVSVYEIFSPLLAGGTLVIVPESIRIDATQFFNFLRDEIVNSVYIPPFMLTFFSDWLNDVKNKIKINRLLVGVEPIPEQLLLDIQSKIPGVKILNGYGPTETTICATLYEISDTHQINRITPIGKPMNNYSIHILDSNLNPVPIGVYGELYIGGVGLSLGYKNRPDLTAERFIPNPFGSYENSRLYKTGDLARFLAEGNVEFFGRIDQQVKIRGFRVELGEIENALKQLEGVKNSAVTIKENKQGHQLLVAYVIDANEHEPNPAVLQNRLKDTLPDYMIPTIFMFLERLPFTPSGKIDRKALPDPNWENEGTGAGIPLTSQTQELLGAIFSQILGVQSVQASDNFFALGGHSLLATQVVSRIREVFGLELPLRVLFERPVLADLAVEIERREKEDNGTVLSPIVPVDRNQEIPLSFSQYRLWFLDQLEPGNPNYNIPTVFKLTGNLNIFLLQQSLNEVVKRHEILRTIFKSINGKPRQIILEWKPAFIPKIDLTCFPEEARNVELERLSVEEATQSFYLDTGPLYHVKLFQIAPDEYWIMLTMHHIISDGWSMGVFMREIVSNYRMLLDDEFTPFSELEIQYADYAMWQHNWLASDVFAKQLQFWQEKLKGSTEILNLPYDRPRPKIQTFHGKHYTFHIDEEILQKLITISRQENVTLFMTLLSAFYVLLSRYSLQDDINIGTPVANRNRADIEHLIGFFVNTVVLRIKSERKTTFRSLLNSVRDCSLESFANQDVPFEKIVNVLKPERNLSYTPLFQVMFTLQNKPLEDVKFDDFALSYLEVENGISQFDLTLSLSEQENGLQGAFEYNTDLFDETTIARMVQHFNNLLVSIVKNPDTKIKQLSILSEVELDDILLKWNRTSAKYSTEYCIHHLFQEQVKKNPDAIALSLGAEQYSYRELNKMANCLAHYLNSFNLKTESLIGISLDRSMELYVALLGILKAGQAFVPLDPNYPAERLAFMISDADIPIVIAQSKYFNIFTSFPIKTILLDSEWQEIQKKESTNLNVEILPDNLAYIVYTSGSTGKPKGVQVSHRSLVNYIHACNKNFKLDAKDRALQFATINFDTAFEEIFPTWMNGATLVPRNPEKLISGEALLDLINKEKISVLNFPTAFWHEWVNYLTENQVSVPESVKVVIVGGDRLIPEKFIEWKRVCQHDVRFINNYGPTECTIVATAFEATDDVKNTKALMDIPIGKPISNVTVYILDPEYQPVPVGVPGELMIGGVGVARGYLKRPDLTAERFVPNPYSSHPGERIYRTGDRAKYLPDGNIQFLGRIDNQVKIRGFRIETSEIESVLLQHEDVKEALVIAKEKQQGIKQLFAYFVPKVKNISTDAIRDYLSEQLPDYMIPSAFRELDEFPMMPNGKIDRKKLPDIEISRIDLKTEFAEAKTDVESQLVEIWQQVLGVREIGIDDNFFELGGDSIISIQMIAKAKQAGLNVSPMQVFQYQTIRSLAPVVKQGKKILAEQGPVTGEVPLTPIQHWFFEQGFSDAHHYNQSLLFAVEGEMEPERLKKVVRALLHHHDALRLQFSSTESGWQQKNAEPGDDIPFTHFDLTDLPVKEQKNIIESKCAGLQSSHDLSSGKLINVAYFNLGEQQSRLLITIHHLAVDGVSWRILLEDFQNAYQQSFQDGEIHLPPKTTSFREWSQKLTRYANDGQIETEKQYWLNLCQKPLQKLKPDAPDGENLESSAQGISVSLNEEETKALLQDIHSAYHTQINDILLTALVKSFEKWHGKRSLWLHLEGHGRENIFEDADISRTVGWFTSLYPVCLDLGTAVQPGDVIKTIKEQLRQIPQNGIGFGLLRYLATDHAIKNELKKLDDLDISFNYLGQFDNVADENSMFAVAPENRGPERSLSAKRTTVLDVTGIILGGKLNMNFTFSRNQFQESTIRSLADKYITELRNLISHCKAPEAKGYTVSDFKMANLTQDKLDKVLAKLNKK